MVKRTGGFGGILRFIIIIIIIIIINIKDWTLWSVPSPKLQLLSPTFLRPSNFSHSLWSVVVACSSTYIFILVRKLDSNSLTKTKNWSGRNKVIETSGRLHPLWSQDKRLRTSRTTDYRHTRQNRWTQTELASSLAKNATKPNPIILRFKAQYKHLVELH